MFRRYGGDDAQLVDRVLKGDQEAFGALVTAYSSVVYGIALAHLHHCADAEDLSQDTFLQAYRSLATLHTPTRFGPWLVTLTKNLCRNALARRGREDRLSQNVNVQPAPAMVHPEREEIHAILLRELESLDETSREVLMLHYFTHKPIRDMAVLLGISKAAATKRLQRARQILGERLLTVAGDALLHEDKPQERTRRIMAAIQAVPLSAAPHLISSNVAGTLTATKVGGVLVLKKVILGTVIVLGLLAGFYWSVQANQTPVAQTPIEIASTVQTDIKVASDQPESLTTTTTEVSQPTEIPKTSEVPEASALEPGEIADPSKYATLSGRTLTELGEPVAGAEVILVCYGIPSSERLYKDNRQLKRAMNRRHQFRTASDAEGRYTINRIRFSGSVGVYAKAQGAFSEPSGTELKEGEHHENIDVLMREDSAIARGRILSATGSPVDDATVTSVDSFTSLCQTDVRGNFEIASLSIGALNVYSPRYGVATFRSSSEKKDTFLELRMPGMASLSGRVTQSDGTPAAGFTVKLQGTVIWPDNGCSATDQSFTTTTDLKGQYEIRDINVGQKMDAIITDTKGQCRIQKALGYLVPNQLTTQDFKISKPIVVRGTIRGKQNHQPLTTPNRFNVTVIKDGLDIAEAGYLNSSISNGIYELTVPGDSGSYFIAASYIPWSYTTFMSYGRTVNLTEGTEQIIDLELPDPFTVALRVVDESGNPIKGANAKELYNMNRNCGVTDDAGRLTYTGFIPRFIPNTSPGISGGAFTIECPGYFTNETNGFIGTPGQILPEETMVLYQEGEAVGRLIALDGEPIVYGKFSIKVTYGDGKQQFHDVATDSTGCFRIKIPATSLNLIGALAPPNPAHSFSRAGLQCSAGQALDLGDIQLENIDRSPKDE